MSLFQKSPIKIVFSSYHWSKLFSFFLLFKQYYSSTRILLSYKISPYFYSISSVLLYCLYLPLILVGLTFNGRLSILRLQNASFDPSIQVTIYSKHYAFVIIVCKNFKLLFSILSQYYYVPCLHSSYSPLKSIRLLSYHNKPFSAYLQCSTV